MPPHYRPPAPAVGCSTGGTNQTVAPSSTPTRALPPARYVTLAWVSGSASGWALRVGATTRH
jgi:hypothetical protein